MKWEDVHLRFKQRNGDLCVAKVEYSYTHVRYMLCYYKDGHLYDAYTIDDPGMFSADDYLDDITSDYVFFGVNIYDERKHIN